MTCSNLPMKTTKGMIGETDKADLWASHGERKKSQIGRFGFGRLQ